MAFHNTNWTAIELNPGIYGPGDIGDGLTASTIHQLVCLTPNGEIKINAKGGGSFTWFCALNDKIDVVIGSCEVAVGKFVGFKSHHQQNYRQQIGQ